MFKKMMKRLFVLTAILVVLGIAGAGAGWYILNNRPEIAAKAIYAAGEQYVEIFHLMVQDIEKLIRKRRLDTQTVFYGQGGAIVGEFGEKREYVKYTDLNPLIVQILVANEDETFFTNTGIDPKGIVRAMVNNYVLRRDKQGGSGLTQQFVKNLTKEDEQNFDRKVVEMLQSRQVRKILTPEQILEYLLNMHDFGNDVRGVQMASKFYFGKPQNELTAGEVAILVRMFKQTRDYNPCRPHQLTGVCKKKGCKETKGEASERGRRIVLGRVRAVTTLFTSQADFDRAMQKPVYTCRVLRSPLSASFGPRFALQQFEGIMANKKAVDKGYTVYTPLDPAMQRDAEAALREAVLEDNTKYPGESPIDGGMVVLRVADGAVVALVGGVGTGVGTYNRANQSRRPPGSTKKICTFGAALEAGATLASICYEEQVEFVDRPGHIWTPENHDKKLGRPVRRTNPDNPKKPIVEYVPEVPLWYAFTDSKNVCSVILEEYVGPRAINDFCHRGGVNSWSNNDLTAAIGGDSEAKLVEYASLYRTMAAGGRRTDPYVIERIVDETGQLVYEAHPETQQTVTATVAYLLTSMGRLVIEHPNGTAHRLNKYVQGDKDHPGLRLSGKTGTTDDGRDGYFILMMPEYVVAVRLGRDNNDPLDPKNKAAGSPLAVDVVGRFLERVKDRLPRGTDFTVPQGIEFRAVDDSGVVTSTGTPGARLLPFSAKHLPPARPEDVFMFRHNSDSKTIYEVGTSSSAQAQNNETEETSVETATTSESPPPMFPQEE